MIELAPQRASEETPDPRAPDNGARDKSGESLPDPESFAQAGQSSTSWPTRAENMLAALPWLMASAMFL
jgi:hypothetical protein